MYSLVNLNNDQAICYLVKSCTTHVLVDTLLGFCASHSYETPLLLTVDDFAKTFDHSLQVDAAILDFTNVFEKASHHHLIRKLDCYGIMDSLLNWLQSLLFA